MPPSSACPDRVPPRAAGLQAAPADEGSAQRPFAFLIPATICAGALGNRRSYRDGATVYMGSFDGECYTSGWVYCLYAHERRSEPR